MKTHEIIRYGAFTGSAAMILALLLPVTVFAQDSLPIIDMHLQAQAADAQGSSPLAIHEVTVVNVEDGSLQSSQTVLIRGNVIETIGLAEQVRVPDDAEVVEAKGKFLIPGLWDMHAHGTTYDREELFLRLLLANGITGFRDPFGSLDVAATVRDAVRAGELPGPPRIIAAGNMVDGPPGINPGAVVASSPAEGRRIVDSLHAEGAPFIKVYFLLAPETYRAIAERSSELGSRSMVTFQYSSEPLTPQKSDNAQSNT